MSALHDRIRARKQAADRDARAADRAARAKKREDARAKEREDARAKERAENDLIKRLEKRGAKKQKPPPIDKLLTALAPAKDGETPQAYLRRLLYELGNRKVRLARAVNDVDKQSLKEEIRILQWGVNAMHGLFAAQYKQHTKK